MVIALAACDPAPSDVREWTAADHDQPASVQSAAAPRPRGSARAGDGDLDLSEIAWERNCAVCHGRTGRGDGPQGPMMRAPDLTRTDWQEKVSDQDILETIRKGRNKMPAFDLPEQALKGLVQRIRTNRQR
jgi:mono/diheme cytochrome c family protein